MKEYGTYTISSPNLGILIDTSPPALSQAKAEHTERTLRSKPNSKPNPTDSTKWTDDELTIQSYGSRGLSRCVGLYGLMPEPEPEPDPNPIDPGISRAIPKSGDD
jgi:hypothetical protein